MFMLESAIQFREKHFPVFITSIFLGVFSNASTLALALGTYFKSMDLDTALKVTFAALMAVSIFQSFCCLNILRGRSSWAGGMAASFYFHLLFSAVAIFFYDLHLGLYTSALVISLAGLYCLNSLRYRSMLQAAETTNLEKKAGPHPRLKNSKRHAAMNNRLRTKEQKVSLLSDRSVKVMILVCWLLSLMFLLVIGVKIYVIYEGFTDGVVIATSRHGPPKSYSLIHEPWMYGFTMFLHLFTIGVCVLFLKVMHLLRK